MIAQRFGNLRQGVREGDRLCVGERIEDQTLDIFGVVRGDGDETVDA